MNREEKAFEFAQETIKQILTFSTGIVALTVTFLKDILPAGTDTGLLEVAWGLYIASILFGLLSLMSLTGTLGSAAGTVNSTGIRIIAGAQALLFFFAMAFTVAFGFEVL